MHPTHLTKAKSRDRLLSFRSFSSSHSSGQAEPSPESKTNRKFLAHFLRIFSTSHSSVVQVQPSPGNKTKGKFLPHFLRRFLLRSTSGALGTDARSGGTPEGAYGKVRSLHGSNGSVYSTCFSSGEVSDGSSKDLRCGQLQKVGEDDPSKRSRWMLIKKVRSRLVYPLRSVRDSYVECMTAAAGDPRIAGLSMGYRGPHSAQLRAGFSSDSFRSQVGHMELSEERIKAILEKSKSYGKAILEE